MAIGSPGSVQLAAAQTWIVMRPVLPASVSLKRALSVGVLVLMRAALAGVPSVGTSGVMLVTAPEPVTVVPVKAASWLPAMSRSGVPPIE